jgi:hypothetical protein
MASEIVDYKLDVTPDTALKFVLTRGDNGDSKSDGTARCVMTLKHPGVTNSHIAFKVKTTQPRRYLVRPNQGIVAPGSSESVIILLVEKDKQMLLQSFDRLGQSALDHSKDKFLVQSCSVDEEFAEAFNSKKKEMAKIAGDSMEATKAGKELAETLTGMWNVASSGQDLPIFNKKLQVRHEVAINSSPSKPTHRGGQEKPKYDTMSPEQMFKEITSLRRKYDELVVFSVNLTAERDILNNTLEQTKRDLNRELAKAKELRAGNAAAGQSTAANKPSSGGFSIFTVFILLVLFFLIGVKAKHLDMTGFLFDLPVLGDALRKEL